MKAIKTIDKERKWESGKYIAKMFSLKKFLVSECDFKFVCFCKSCKESETCFTKCIRCKIFPQIGIGMVYLHVFLITMHELDTAV